MLFVGQMVIGHAQVQEAAVAVSWVMTSFSASLFTSILVYRIFFHRLRSFPGPFLAKTTKFWHVSKVARNSDNFRQLDNLYHRYGDFVRTAYGDLMQGPNEVTMFSPEALTAVLGLGSKCTKTGWYDVLKPLIALNTTRDKGLHDRRRRIWNRGFSKKALHDYEDRVGMYSQELKERISKSAGKPINMTAWSRYFSFDVMGDFAFGRSFDMMRNGKNHFIVDIIRQGMAVIGPFTPVPWLFIIGKSVPGLANRWKRLLAWTTAQLRSRMEIMSYILQASIENKSTEKDMPYMSGDAAAMIIAGSDTVASSLTFLFYYLAKYPQEVITLRTELGALKTPLDLSILEKCSHLNGFISETLRLHPPVPSGVLRNTPSQGLMVGDRHIPGHTTVLVPIYTLGRRSDCFELAEEFIPRRWSSQPHLVKNKDAFVPFSIGAYSCVGKNLALMELRSVIATVISEFDVSFAPGEDGMGAMGRAKDTFTLSPGELQLVFHPIEK
ncbi:MAG: hypothetical protein ALECFALPRED_001001 [Alectoria fallacina]|uniref:Cytochrome P450 n=1 Tax=Alectoria fallacina TaxID=1903189 RepID=A0A8H3I6V2_9LECA|nr:MAG: hypothetical protein ALECFALPRED_001001 [Alectoria fallacina]